MSAFLETLQLGRTFGGLKAVDDVSIAIQQGELVGLIGPNGAGKTTLFNLISGFTAPTSGEVRLKGERIDGLTPHDIAQRGIGRTFQNLRIFPNISVFDNVTVGAIGHENIGLGSIFPWQKAKSDRITQKSFEALQSVGLLEEADQLAANISYGKRKYLEIARALAMQPDLLILDEPAAGLNETETQHLASFISRLHQEGRTIILIEHDMRLVMSICQRVIVLASGRKICDGTPDMVQKDTGVLEAYLGVDE
jgi:branched-chain amino acid transport system ATP-binding protein